LPLAALSSTLGAVGKPLEFPDESVAACVKHYRRPTREHPEFSKKRRAGRSFPTDYTLGTLDDSIEDHWNWLVRELEAYRGRGPKIISQTRQSVAADKRVFAGPSELDLQELPYIDDAWCVAEFICADLGLRADTWTKRGLGLAHVRYGMMLDWLTREIARRMVRERDGLERDDDGRQRYGLDPMRIAMEHGAVPDELDELAAAAGLYRRGGLAPFGTRRESRIRDQWIPPETDPGYLEIAALRQRLAAHADPV
jgi:hypothetical protein